MIQINNFPYSRTGNHIIQYLFGVVLSKDKGYNLYTPEIKGFSNIKNIINKKSIQLNHISVGYGQQYTDYQRLINHNGSILIDGYLQNYIYYKNHIDELKQYIITDEKSDYTPNDNDLVMHVRLTDYIINNNNVPFLVYDNFIKENLNNYENFIIVTDEPTSTFITDLLKNNKTKLIHQTMFKDFDLLRQAKNTFISQSSYSWLTSYFGNAENIFVPLSIQRGRYLWLYDPNIYDINLIDKTDNRFKIITF